MRSLLIAMVVLAQLATAEKKTAESSPLDRYLVEAARAPAVPNPASPGSLFSDSGMFDLARDRRASQVNDLVTVIVEDEASAISRATTNSSRKASATASFPTLLGPTSSRLANLAGLSGETELQGQGETSRESVLTTTISARVIQVLSNGNLVIDGSKDISVNSERQLVTLRGIVRWNDLTPGNTVRSDRVALLEIRVNGKGVVGDAVRRPHFLYRLLLGILPF